MSDSCDPMDCSPLGSFVHGISQARILEWIAISSCRGTSQPRDWTHISCISCITGRFFIHWAIGEAKMILLLINKGRSHHRIDGILNEINYMQTGPCIIIIIIIIIIFLWLFPSICHVQKVLCWEGFSSDGKMPWWIKHVWLRVGILVLITSKWGRWHSVHWQLSSGLSCMVSAFLSVKINVYHL